MKTPRICAPRFTATIAALSSASALVLAAPVAPQEKYQLTPMLQEDGTAIVTRQETAAMHASLEAAAQRKEDAARVGSVAAPSQVATHGGMGAGAECRIPSSNAADHVCRAPSGEMAGAAGPAPYGTGLRYSVGRKTYMLPLEDSDLPGR